MQISSFKRLGCSLTLWGALAVVAPCADTPSQGDGQRPPDAANDTFDDGPGSGGPPPFGPGGFGGMMHQRTDLVKQFDKDGDGRLNKEERKAARAYLATQQNNGGPGRRGGPPGGFFGGGENQAPAQPGVKIAPTDVMNFPGAPLYDPQTLRTFFLEFDSPDWEKELADFKNTDVEVPAQLKVDGKKYADIGVRFRGNTSFMMVSEGHKRSFSLSLDFTHEKQQLGGFRTLHLLNSNEDPTFLRIVLFCQIAREYIPAPRANFVRVVINGESWGVYANLEQFNKDYVKDWYGTSKGARWKVPGSPDGQGGLNYLGADAAPYKRIYQIKSKDDPKSWADLIQLCKVLNETPANKLEAALAPLLDIDGVLKFLALDNAMINGDGFWTRASDYGIYEDEKGRFHVLPLDVNETFSSAGGGPGGPGGPGGFGGQGGPGRQGGPGGFGRFGGPGGPGGFGPGMLLAPRLLAQADKNGDQKLTREEFTGLANTWFDKLDPDKTGKVSQEQFVAKLGEILPPPQGQQGLGRPGVGGPGGFDPVRFTASPLFQALNPDKDASLTRNELEATFDKWFTQWDTNKSGALNEAALRTGLNAALPQPNFAGGPMGAAMGGRGGRGGGGPGFGGGASANGLELDPLIDANDTSKPLISKLLAVPALRARYLGYVREIAEKWLDWNKLGPVALQYQALIAADVKADTRKLDSFDDFTQGLAGETAARQGFGPGGQPVSLKNFADKRRAYLLSYAEVKKH